ncbi:hypothetical protein ACWDA3_55585 [Nonomuraea rubra]
MALNVGELVAFVQMDTKDFDRGARDVERGLKAMQGSTTSATGRMERDVSGALAHMLRDSGRTFDAMTRDIIQAGQEGGSGLVRSLDRALDAVDQIAGQAGRDAGSSFVKQAQEMLRYGDFDVDVDADISAALAALAELEQAAEASGVRAGDGFVRGADGRLRDARGRFVSESSTLFDPLVESAERAGGLVGRALESAIGVLGQTTPGQVAIAIGAIGGLPVAAQVAAAGITLALGGALATVGLTSAAQADRVKVEWSDLASELRRELGDVAAPLEDSAIHASEVARQAFQALKPTLREVFADLGPDVDHFVDGLGDAVDRIGPSLEPLGRAFGDLLTSLGDRADDMGEDLSGAITSFAETTSRHADDIANLFAMITTSIRMAADGAGWLADRWNGFLTVNEKLHGALLGINKDYDGSNAAIGRMMESMRTAVETAYGLNTATDESSTAVRNLSAALEDFYDPAAKALDAEIRLKAAIEDATQAAKDKSMSEVERLRSVQDLTKAIADAATTEATSTGKTVEAGRAYMDNIGRLNEWAKGNDAAKATVAALGDSLGITTVKTKDGTFAVNALGEAVELLPKGKTTKVDADTKEGKKQLAEIKKALEDLKDKTVNVNVRTTYDSKEARAAAIARDAARGARSGAIYNRGVKKFAAGGIQAFAAGGRVTPPNIANGPTYLYGEGNGPEAFIPYESQFRSRAIDLLSQVAHDFGLEVYNKGAANRMSAVQTVVDDARTQLGRGIDDTISSLMDTLGDSGSLTSAVADVGRVGENMTAAWQASADMLGGSVDSVATVTSDAVTVVSESVDGLTGSVKDLLMALAMAQTGGSSGGRGKSGGYGHLLEPMDEILRGMTPQEHASRAAKAAASMIGRMGLKLPKLSPPGGMIAGDYGLSGTPDWTPGTYSAISYGMPPTGGSSTPAATSTQGGVTVNMYDTTIREEADVSKLGREVAYQVAVTP